MVQLFTMRSGIKVILAMQGALAGLMLFTELDALGVNLPSRDEHETQTPISPGDQVRRFTPRIPGKPEFMNEPGFTLPDETKESLQFTDITIPDFGKLLLVTGRITAGDAARFAGHLDNLGEHTPLIALHSPGGLVDEAIFIGKRIREWKLNTIVLPGANCFSACPYILAGGVERIVSTQGNVGLHQHYYETPSYMPAFLAVEDIQIWQGETMSHLIEMGVEAEVMLFSLRTVPEDIYILVKDELFASRLATKILE
jgi:hypothetical protein